MFAISRFAFVFLVLACYAETTLAGGSYESVVIKTLKLTNESTYQLSFELLEPSDDPFFKNCKTVEVDGRFENDRRPAKFFTRPFPDSVTLDGHKAAISMLQLAQRGSWPINFGWMGPGLRQVDPKVPCKYQSKALGLQTEHGAMAVLSFHDPI